MKIKHLSEAVISFFYPVRCAYCGAVMERKDGVCGDCKKELPVIPAPHCIKCGETKQNCVCFGRRYCFSGIAAPFYYSGKAREGILRLKFRHKYYTAQILGIEMAKSVKIQLEGIGFDMVVPVPLSRKSRKHRGYNQSELLARQVGSELKIPMGYDVLQKPVNNKMQHMLNESERKENVKGVYKAVNTERLKGKTVLLCDDIKTTGATLNECARVLLEAGAEKVYCVCAAIRGKRKNN